MTKITTCKHWIKHKRRFCKFTVAPDSEEGYCPVHCTGTGDKERIPCPIDPRHMIYKIDQDKHVKKCSMTVQINFANRQPFTVIDCNLVKPQDDPRVGESVVRENLIDAERLDSCRTQLVERILRVVPQFKYSSSFVDPVDVSSRASKMQPSFLRDGDEEEATKHDFQNVALLRVLEQLNLAPVNTDPKVYVELGCGKAGLSRWLMHYCENECPAPGTGLSDALPNIYLLMDCEARRNKQERKRDLIGIVSQDQIVRLRSNIKDVDLSLFLQHSLKCLNDENSEFKRGSPEHRLHNLRERIYKIQSHPSWPLQKVVGTAKHLCGAATDLGLRCLLNACKEDSQTSLVFATCCHHSCDWDQLVGKDVLADTGACNSATEFKELIAHAGWATTAGIGEEKRKIGRLVKELIDLSRVFWIANNLVPEELRAKISLQYMPYIDGAITPENFAISLSAVL